MMSKNAIFGLIYLLVFLTKNCIFGRHHARPQLIHQQQFYTEGKIGESTDASWSLDFELGAPIGRHGLAFILIEAGQGAGVTDEPGVGDSFFGVNDDAGDSEAKLEVTEVWYEHQFWQERVTFTLGKVDLTNYFDANEVANDETVQFLSTGLVNSVAVEFPDDNGAGVRLTVSPIPRLDLSLGIAEADADFEDLFKDPFIIVEAVFNPTFGELAGHYRAYWWINKGDHTPFNNPGSTREDNWGVGLSFDQQLIDPLTAFFRLAFQDGDVSAIDVAWSAGLALQGTWWQRPNDVVGFAIGQALLSGDFARSAEAPLNTRDELFVEAYYQLVFTDHLALSAHIQFIDNPGGNQDLDTVTVVGGRMQVTF